MTKNGMLLALLDEYKRATIALKQILATLSQESFEKITDKDTKDPDCKSVQTITTHIIQSGYTYANYINAANNKAWFEYSENVETPNKGITEIDKMLDFTEQSFESLWYKTNKDIEKLKFNTRWNVTYDFEQLMEHAIVHILRHRRQIENAIKN
ncbi:DinB family protein [Thalassobellus sediminis]|uniref:DinB family protein n=1 Tax=Thalassobellus sediminis TaxID=3367753 RepID=UPI0037B18C68